GFDRWSGTGRRRMPAITCHPHATSQRTRRDAAGAPHITRTLL
ncbi:MAG: hypothetical protein AVDCRST_MAG70-190, partial [uncultured Thermomicrobiales bacterium]